MGQLSDLCIHPRKNPIGCLQDDDFTAKTFPNASKLQPNVTATNNNQAFGDIELGQLDAARAGLREGLALALNLGALPWVVAAVISTAFAGRITPGVTSIANAALRVTFGHARVAGGLRTL